MKIPSLTHGIVVSPLGISLRKVRFLLRWDGGEPFQATRFFLCWARSGWVEPKAKLNPWGFYSDFRSHFFYNSAEFYPPPGHTSQAPVETLFQTPEWISRDRSPS